MDLRELQHIGYRELHYFVAVAEELHFARAAERIGIHQSPLSKAITIMERDLGARLFIRTHKGTQLTEFGEALLPDAKRILAEAQRVRSNLAAAAAGRSGRLHLAICEEAALPWVAKLLSLSRKEDPEVVFTMGQRTLPAQLDDLRLAVVDVGLVSSASDHWIGAHEDIEAIALWSDPLVLAVRSDSAMAVRSEIASLEAQIGPYILAGGHINDVSTIRHIIQQSPDNEAAVEIAESLGMLFTMVAAGHGVGLVSVAVAATVSRPDILFHPLALKRARVTTYLLTRRHHKPEGLDRLVDRARRVGSRRADPYAEHRSPSAG